MSLEKIRNNNQIIFETLAGSRVYQTFNENSDSDIRGVYMSSLDDLFGINYEEQISDDNNDVVFYELKRFLQLLSTNNPNCLELIYTPEKYHIHKHPIMNLIFDNKNKFLTKLCKNSFCGYAVSQIKKARGLDKKMNWENEKIERKTILDFCYIPENCNSMSIVNWLGERGLKQEYCGLVNLPHMRGVYSVFYDFYSHNENELNDLKGLWDNYEELSIPIEYCSKNLKFKGIIQKGEQSNDISFSEIPKKDVAICTMSFNKDAYSTHCKKYKEYKDWLEKRNTQRYVDIKGHGQQIDGKNMLHCVRLIKTAKEIAEGKGIIVERPDAQELIKIRKGDFNLESIIEWSEEQLSIIENLFDDCNLPETVDEIFINDLLIQTRKQYFKL